MRIYLDEDMDAKALARLLRSAGHDVLEPRRAGTKGLKDEDQLSIATSKGLPILTANARDYTAIHDRWTAESRHHAGILLVFLQPNRSLNKQFFDILDAVRNLELSVSSLRTACTTLTSGDSCLFMQN